MVVDTQNLALVFEGLRQSKTGLILLVYLVLIFMVIMSSILYMVEEDPLTVGYPPETLDAEDNAFTVHISPSLLACLSCVIEPACTIIDRSQLFSDRGGR